jgi:prepilin-type N-terminal cleavage/methylation domain-containing protein
MEKSGQKISPETCRSFLKSQRGFSMVEILVVIAVIVFCLSVLLGIAIFSIRVSNLLKETSQANFLAQETLETVRNFRDGTDWTVDGLGIMTVDSPYHLEEDNSLPFPKWELVQGMETIGIFTRKVIFESVKRDLNYNIVTSGGTTDNNTRRVVVTVSWRDQNVGIVTYFTNWKN